MFAQILCKQKRIYQNRYIRLINNIKNTASAISLRWHYPNQVTGPDHLVRSQPAIGKLPFYPILLSCFTKHPTDNYLTLLFRLLLLTDDIITLYFSNYNIFCCIYLASFHRQCYSLLFFLFPDMNFRNRH